MPNKKVLIITYYWPPSGGAGVQRWVKFCKYLPEFGIDPIVLTVKDGTYPILDDTLINEISENIPIYQSKIIEPYSIFAKLTGSTSSVVATPASAFDKKNSLTHKLGVWIRANVFIPDARIGWFYSARRKAMEIIRSHNVDTFITTGPPNTTHVIGHSLKKKKPEMRWLMDMRDPWSKIFFNQKIPRSTIAKKIDKSLERKALSTADTVTVVSKGMSLLQSDIYNRPYEIIPNGFDHQDFNNKSARMLSDKFSIKYVGSLTASAIPSNLFEAISLLPDRLKDKIELEFYGSHNNQLLTEIEKFGLNSLSVFNDYIPHLEAKKEMQNSNLLLLVIPNTADNELIVTGKIFDYIGAQVPILCIGPIPGDASDIIQELNAGVCFDYNDITNLQNWLSRIISEGQIPYNAWNDDYKNHPYSRYSLSNKMASLLLS